MLVYVAQVMFVNVSEEHAASIFRVGERTKREESGIDIGNGIAGLGALGEQIGLRRGGKE
jgi:hypothetical protein